MSDVSYKPIISEMRWSFSRINSFYDCQYKWFLKYIKGIKEFPQFYAGYGKFIHKLIENYYIGKIKKESLTAEFLINFTQEVKGLRPKYTIVENYIEAGKTYFNNFKPFPYKTIAVEKEIEFEIDGIPFICFIDYIGEENGDIIIVDNKSRKLSPRSNRNKPTKNDLLIDEMMRQLYLYSAAVKKEYGVFPKYLCFNCFVNGVFIKEEFDLQKYNEAIEWAVNSIRKIEDTDGFPANPDYFKCKYLCGVSDCCEYCE